MVKLKEMSDAEFSIWNENVWIAYRSELILAGMSESEADENIKQNQQATMPEGRPAVGHYLFKAIHNNESVGSVWLNDQGSSWFIYVIEIDESHRGKGLGRGTLRAIEEFIRGKGGTQIRLSVFGFNDVAQKLYLSEGFSTARMFMMKNLDSVQ